MTWKSKIQEYIHPTILFILLSCFVLLKIQDLFLPYFWDEAWSYVPAITEMVASGPSLTPNSIAPELSRGHPLLFYFLSSVWIQVFGSAIWITKIFPLLTSLLLVIAVYAFTKKHFDNQTGLLTVLMLMIQSVFFAQSTFLLPEILLALFTVLSLHAYLNKNRLLTVVWLTLALYTKESAINLWITIALFELIDLAKRKDVKLAHRLWSFSSLMIPVLLIAIFYISQKSIVGWYFYPDHIAFLRFDTFGDHLKGYASYLFIYMGRNVLTLMGLIALIFILAKKDKVMIEKKRVLYILTFFVIAYLLFSSFNFHSPRYLLSILPFTVLIWVYFLRTALRKYHASLSIIVFLVVILNNLYFTINKRGGHDHTLGYRDLIHVHQEMVDYCERNELYDKNIYTGFLMLKNLTNHNLGYLKSEIIFTNTSSSLTPASEYAIMSSSEFDPSQYESIKAKGQIIQRFEKHGCWTELILIADQ